MMAVVSKSPFPILVSALLISSSLVACFKADPYEEGQTLGQKHAELVQKKAIKLEALMKDLEQYEQKYREDQESQRKFNRGYQEAIEPVKAEIAALFVEAYGEAAGKAAVRMVESFGKGMAAAIDGLAKELDGKDFEKTMGRLGRGMGKFMKKLEKGVGEMSKEYDKAVKSD